MHSKKHDLHLLRHAALAAEVFNHHVDECQAIRIGDWETKPLPTRVRCTWPSSRTSACGCAR